MNRARERRFSLTSQLQNIPIVRNKGEQMKLEKKQRFLEKAREKESVGLSNKRKELIDLNAMSTAQCQAKANDTRGPCRQSTNPDARQQDIWRDLKATRRPKPFSRSKSLTGLSTIPPIFGNGASGNVQDGKRATRRCSHFGLSRSFDSSRNCPRCKSTLVGGLAPMMGNEDSRTGSGDAAPDAERESERNLREILPPACLLPLYKQNSKSLKEKSKTKAVAKPAMAKSCSMSDLTHCRYLRLRLFSHKC